jgi:hypothetical protein
MPSEKYDKLKFYIPQAKYSRKFTSLFIALRKETLSGLGGALL